MSETQRGPEHQTDFRDFAVCRHIWNGDEWYFFHTKSDTEEMVPEAHTHFAYAYNSDDDTFHKTKPTENRYDGADLLLCTCDDNQTVCAVGIRAIRCGFEAPLSLDQKYDNHSGSLTVYLDRIAHEYIDWIPVDDSPFMMGVNSESKMVAFYMVM